MQQLQMQPLPPPQLADYHDYHHASMAPQIAQWAGPAAANGMDGPQFYLHEPSPVRRTWGQPQPMAGPADPSMGPYGAMVSPMRRAWGTPQPVSAQSDVSDDRGGRDGGVSSFALLATKNRRDSLPSSR